MFVDHVAHKDLVKWLWWLITRIPIHVSIKKNIQESVSAFVMASQAARRSSAACSLLLSSRIQNNKYLFRSRLYSYQSLTAVLSSSTIFIRNNFRHLTYGEGLLSSTSERASESPQPDEYTLNLGQAIATLRTDLPNFFHKGFSNTDIFSPDILLTDLRYTGARVRGRFAYIGISNMLRLSLSAWFEEPSIEIVRIWLEPENNNPHDHNEGRDLSIPVTDLNLPVRCKSHLDMAKFAVPLDNDFFSPTCRKTSSNLFSTSPLTPIPHSPPPHRLYIRFHLTGLPRTSVLLSHARYSTPPSRLTYTVLFLYRFDIHGRIIEQSVESISPPPSKKALWVHGAGGWWWNLREAMRKRAEGREIMPVPGVSYVSEDYKNRR